MIEVIREFVVREDARSRFELAFGPGGAWSKLVASQSGFRGTTLLADTKNARRFLVVEVWDEEAEREKLLASQRDEFSRFESELGAWIVSRTEVGTFRLRAQGSVRPIRKARSRGGRGGHA